MISMAVAFVASIAGGLWLPRRVARRARSERHQVLREFAAEFDWSIVALTASFADAFPVPPLAGAWSAQSDLAIQGWAYGWAATVALVSIRMHGMPRADQLALVSVLDPGPGRREFVATHSLHGVHVVALTPGEGGEVANFDSVRNVLRASPDFARGDSVALSDAQLAHVHPLRPGQKSLPVAGSVEMLTRLATVLAPAR
jgi:hypothetical protein